MKDGHKTAIEILSQSQRDGVITYQLEIKEGNQIIYYYARYSELHKLFHIQSQTNIAFPNKQSIARFFGSLLGQSMLSDLQDQRYNDLKHFFQEISKGEELEREPGFKSLVQKARKWEKSTLKQRPPQRLRFGSSKGLGEKSPYILA